MIDINNLPNRGLVRRKLAERELVSFLKQSWSIIEPSTTYVHNWHIDLIAEYLTAVSHGEIKRLIINIPPRYMKSILTSVMWPCWTWTTNPHVRWLFASYSASLSTKHSLDRRNIIESDWYQSRWKNEVMMRKDQNMKTEFMNTKYGSMVATSVGGSVTGKGGDIIVVDDPLNPEKALSEVERESANRWIDQTLSTRLNNKKTGAIVVIMQRLHDDDVTGHLLNKETWTQLSLESPFQRGRIIAFPISKEEKMLEAGEALWEEREPVEVLEQQKVDMGSWAFAAQYGQSPAPLEGGLVKRAWFKFYDRAPIEHMTQFIQSWDMTFKETKKGSYVTGQMWGRFNADKYLLAQIRRRMGFVDTIAAVKAFRKQWPQTQALLIEDKANGPAVIDSLKSKIPGIISVSPEGSKIERFAAESPQIESGNVYIPHPDNELWVDDYLHELTTFPNASNDDQTDATSQALRYMPTKIDVPSNYFKEGTIYGENRLSANMDW